MRGYLYSPQLERSIPFENLMQLFLLLEDLMNHTNLPQRTMELRMFPTEEDARAAGASHALRPPEHSGQLQRHRPLSSKRQLAGQRDLERAADGVPLPQRLELASLMDGACPRSSGKILSFEFEKTAVTPSFFVPGKIESRTGSLFLCSTFMEHRTVKRCWPPKVQVNRVRSQFPPSWPPRPCHQ